MNSETFNEDDVTISLSGFLSPSGKGTTYFENTNNRIWIVPIFNNIESTVLRWLFLIYPEFKINEFSLNPCIICYELLESE